MNHRNPATSRRYLPGRIVLLCWFSLVSWCAVAQTSNVSMDQLADRINLPALKCPAGLVYLQTNKDIYESGEDLWFKAYILDSHSFIPSSLCKTLYLQLIDEKTGTALINDRYEITKGFADGHLFLQDNLPEGDYTLAAYTTNSFYRDSTAQNGVCRIKVKKDVNPHLSVTPNFSKMFYGPKDSIKVKISVLNEYGEIPPYTEIRAELKRNDKVLGQVKGSTDPGGEATVAFASQKSGTGLRVDLKVKYALKELALSLPVPAIKGSPVQFELFPDGGNLVSELASRLAFKAVGITGEPLDVEGTLFEDDQQVLDFKSTHAGMGSLMFIPDAGKKYTIRLSKPKSDSVYQLPTVYPKGIVMYPGKRSEQYVEFHVLQSKGMGKQTVYLRGQLRGVVYCMARGVLDEEVKFKIPFSEFPYQGIGEFTLFDELLRPVAERLVYVNPQKRLTIETKLSKEKFETREKVALTIRVKDDQGMPVIANLGVSVFDKIYADPQRPGNLLSYYFLTSQLRGRVYDPGYYFDTLSKQRSEDLDLLLMTQGWRRYVWSEENMKVAAVSNPLIRDEIPGEVYLTKNRKPGDKPEQIVKAFSPEKRDFSEVMITDSLGRFEVNTDQLLKGKGGYVYLVPYGSVESGPKIRLSDPFQTINETRAKKVTDWPVSKPPTVKKREEQISFTGNHNAIKLPEVLIKGKGIRVFRDKYMGYLDSLAKLKTHDYVCVNHILNCSNHGMNLDNTLPVEGETYKVEVGAKVPGKRFTYVDQVYHYPQYTEEELMAMYNFSRVKGYSSKKVFYQPNYDKVSDENLIPDYRNTLLWEPSAQTDEKGEATFHFFCSDINFDFVGRVEGVSGGGLLGSGQFKFPVRKPVIKKD